MTGWDEIQQRVDRQWHGLGLPSWPNPHAGRDASAEEYSRVTDPGRYRIVRERARVWASVLGTLPGVRVTATGADWEIRSGRPGTLPLLFTVTDGEPDVLRVAAGRPDLEIGRQPDCGCDACDWGSADLLEAIDDTVRSVVEGPYVRVNGAGWHAAWWPRGGEAHNAHDYDAMMDLCRRLAAGAPVTLPAGAEAFVGQSWLAQ